MRRDDNHCICTNTSCTSSRSQKVSFHPSVASFSLWYEHLPCVPIVLTYCFICNDFQSTCYNIICFFHGFKWWYNINKTIWSSLVMRTVVIIFWRKSLECPQQELILNSTFYTGKNIKYRKFPQCSLVTAMT